MTVILDGADATPAAVAELAAGLRLRHYKFDKYKSAKPDDAPATLTITLVVNDQSATDAAIADRGATVTGTLLARDLINEPANVLGPLEFAAKAAELASLGVEVEILEPAEMQRLGMNSLLCVAQGSSRPARLVVMHWRGGDAGVAPLAFVGKGVVFDTGGISIKPAGSMEDMKGDMGGAAAVTGLMLALATRKAPVNAVGVIGLVENMPDANAVRPGDIVKAMSGTTIEVINTDAEGRLVLADALWYTQDRFKPRFMINLATLTGAIIVALGHDHGGLFSNDDELSAHLLAAGLAANEKLWRMPLGPAYDKIIESRFADIKNSAGRPAGSISPPSSCSASSMACPGPISISPAWPSAPAPTKSTPPGPPASASPCSTGWCGTIIRTKVCRDSGQDEPKMVGFENRRAAYVQVREHRKRRNLPFAGRPGMKIGTL